MNTHHLDTRLVHQGEHSARSHGGSPTAMPIYASATFVYPDAAELDAALGAASRDDRFVYSRYGNPTVAALESAVASIEEGRVAVACASGMAALHLAVLAAGTPLGSTQPHPRHILAASELYGATHTLLRDFFAAQNTGLSLFDATELAELEESLKRHQPDVVLIESLSNPLLKVADVRAIAERVHAAKARLIVDATMASPILHRPLVEGADLVVHSATKFLGGHGDVVGGVLAARSGFMLDTARRYVRLLGVGLGPFDARWVSRGMKTLSLRVRQQCANAMRVAEWLRAQPGVSRVIYPGLQDHPQHALAARQFGGLFGALVTFELAEGTAERAFALMDRLQLILPATSLGDVYTLISYPAISSHRDVPPEERRRLGIGDGVLRLSVGIEDVEDLIADLEQALGARAARPHPPPAAA